MPDVRNDLVVALLDLRPYAFVDAAAPASGGSSRDLGELALGARAARGPRARASAARRSTLSGLMLPTPARAALDLGTGCGIQALHARPARPTRRRDRHLGRARCGSRALNAGAERVDGIELRLGQPVRAGRGGAVRPHRLQPAVRHHPAGRRACRRTSTATAGWSATRWSRRSCADAGTHLAPGGVAQLLGNWEYRGDGDGLDRVRELGGRIRGAARRLGDRARGARTRLAYAETWIRDGGTRPGTRDVRAALLGAWLDDFAARDVTRGRLRLRAAAAPGRRRRRPLRAVRAAARAARLRGGRPRRAPRRRVSPRTTGRRALDDDGLRGSRLVVARRRDRGAPPLAGRRRDRP